MAPPPASHEHDHDHDHDHEHDHDHDHGPTAPVTLFHVTAPTCWWSWGYEGTLQRVRRLYGDQVDIRLLLGVVYQDVDEYFKDYELDWKGLNAWAVEGRDLMGVPIHTDYTPGNMPRSVLRASHAVLAADLQGQDKSARLLRALLRRFCVEAQDVTDDHVLHAAAEEAGLDLDRFKEDLADEAARQKELEGQGGGFPHAPLNFYNVVLQDADGRLVILENAFDPAVVEEAIEWLGRGKVRRLEPKVDLVGYLRAHGPAPTKEVARVFGLDAGEAERRLTEAVKRGDLAGTKLAGAAFWKVADAPRKG